MSLLLAKTSIAAEKGIRIVVDEESTFAPDGTTDPVTVPGNLIDNALEAIGSDGTVLVQLTDDVSGATIIVSDDGPGIAEKNRLRMFEAGQSTRDCSRPGVRGFGLALVQRVAVRRDGTVTTASSPQGGATFTVRLAAVQQKTTSGTST